MADEVKLTKGFWKANETPLTAANLNLMVDTIVDNTTAIEDLKDKQLKMKPKFILLKIIIIFHLLEKNLFQKQ